ncbi:MAG: ATP-grasp domain-containing protein [Bacteroidales bacterium]|nr:ATP-grasp domain-containing protein [Bacteroidales bacterium]
MENKKVIILHNAVAGNSNPDEADVLHQVELVSKALTVLGYHPIAFPLQDDLIQDMKSIEKSEPLFVFNLVEAVFNKGELLYMGPALLNALKIPYTGVPVEGLFLTTNKVLTKKILEYNHIPTPGYFTTNEVHRLKSGTRYLLKPVSEDGSVGLDEDAVFTVEQTAITCNISRQPASHYFIEEYIEGREFNISILGGKGKRDALPAAEMIFNDYPAGKPRILGYKAKWDESSAEFKNTTRAFNTLSQESPLYRELVQLTEACWDCFNLKGFARVDFRIDQNEQPYVIEINGNPCISPDSGFIAAANQAGLSSADVIARIIEELT